MARYTAIVDGHKGAYGVVFPDLPGCTSQGRTIEEALRNAVEAVRMWVEDAIADGEDVPRPRSIDDLIGDREVMTQIRSGGVIASVPFRKKIKAGQ